MLVGEEKQEFVVHKDLIVSRSPFFEAAAAQRWASSECTQPIELPVDKPNVFADYLHCLYLGRIKTPEDESDYPSRSAYLVHTLDLYVLADKLGDLTSANIVIDHVMALNKAKLWVPPLTVARHAFEHTAVGSPLRRLFVDFYVHNHPLSDDDLVAFENAVENGLVEFSAAILREFARIKQDDFKVTVAKAFFNKTSCRPKCHYHEHNETCPPCAESAEKKE